MRSPFVLAIVIAATSLAFAQEAATPAAPAATSAATPAKPMKHKKHGSKKHADMSTKTPAAAAPAGDASAQAPAH